MIKNYKDLLFLFIALILGSGLGFFWGEDAAKIKPLGDIFLNLLFTTVVPLVFFSISSAVAGMGNTKRLGAIFMVMLAAFILTGIFSAMLMIIGVMAFDPAKGLVLQLAVQSPPEPASLADKLVQTFTVSDFSDLFHRKNMLALIVMAVLVGLGAQASGEKGAGFCAWLKSGNEVMLNVVRIIMRYAPIGLGAYFAYLVGSFGPHLLGTYARAMVLYYPMAFGYFFVGFSFYAFIAAGWNGIDLFWRNIVPAALTAFGTGSSVATIPVNLEAARRIGTPEDIREMVIPIGSTIHMDGSCMSAILKISILFAVFGKDFSDPWIMLGAVGVALLSGIVMSGIPGGGFLGEMLIVSFYGLPPEALPIAAMIGTLVDPPATLVNAVGDNVIAMVIARILNGRDWIKKPQTGAG